MTLARKTALALATAWPLLYMLAFFAFIVVMFAYTSSGGPIELDRRPDAFIGTLIGLHLFTMLEMMALTGVYLYLVFKLTPPDASNERIVWVLAVVLGGFIGQAVFFFIRVWPAPLPARA